MTETGDERTQLIGALERSLREKGALLDALPAHIAVVDQEGYIVFVNEAWKEFARSNNLSDDRFGVGSSYLEVCESSVGEGSDDGRSIAEGLRETIAGRRTGFLREYCCETPSGQRWFQAMIRPIRDDESMGAIVMHIDVTERILAEMGLHEQNEVMRFQSEMGEVLRNEGSLASMLEKSVRLIAMRLRVEVSEIWVRDPHSGSLQPYPKTEEKSPTSASESFSIREDLANQVAERQESHLSADTIALPLIVNGETVGVLAAGADGPISEIAKTVLATAADDIALGIDRKRREEELCRLAKAVEGMSESTVITDPDGTIIYTNPAFTAITGYTEEEALGSNRNILNSSSHPKEFYDELWRTIAGGRTWSGRITNRRKDGRLYQEEMTISPIHDEGGGIVSFVAVGRDITHEVEIEARTRQSEKMEAVGQLAAGIAHDFNNLLQVILAYSSFLKKETEPGTTTHEDVERIVAASERAADLTRQLLAFSRQDELSMHPFDPRPLLKEAVKLLTRTLPTTIELTCNIPSGEDFPQVVADPVQLNQVFLNLCVNARDAMPDGGSLNIEVAADRVEPGSAESSPEEAPVGDCVRITVSDTGAGIPPEIQDRIFEPFFTTKGNGRGTGLGLSSAYGIVKQHGGVLVCDSRSGEGASFSVLLPVHRESGGRDRSDPDDADLPKGDETLLIVDDDPNVLASLERVFGGLGYRTLAAVNGAEAMARFDREKQVDLVLTDVQMPKGDGIRVARHIRERKPETKVVFQSGFVNETILGECRGLGVDCIIQKPVDPIEIARRIREMLDRGRSG